MLVVPEDTNPITVVEEKLCSIFGAKFIRDYQAREIRKAILYHKPDSPPERQYAHPAPVHEIVADFFQYDMDEAYDRGYPIGYNKAFRQGQNKRFVRKNKWDNTPNSELLHIELPQERLKRWAPEATDEQIAAIASLYREAIIYKYEIGFTVGYDRGQDDILHGRKSKYHNPFDG